MRVTFIGDPQSKTGKRLLDMLSTEGVQVYHLEDSDVLPANLGEKIRSYSKLKGYVVASDVVIGDESSVSADGWHGLALAVEYNRPTLLLLPSKGVDKSLTKRLTSRNLQIVFYDDVQDIGSALNAFLDEAKKSLDAKLFMNIPPAISRYLDWVATYTSRSKSDVVRQAVEEAASKDVEYQKFLRSLDK